MIVDIQPYQIAQGVVSQIRPATMKSVLIIGVKGKALHQEKPDCSGYSTSYLIEGKTFASDHFSNPAWPLDVVEDFSGSEVWVGRKILETVPIEKAFFGFSIAANAKLADTDLLQISMEVARFLSGYMIHLDLRIASVLAGSVTE